MLWEELTASEFKEALEKSNRTCILPLGVIEKHGTHLPLGTDMYTARRVAEEIVKVVPVVVFPYYFFGQIAEARHCPGTIAIRPDLLYSLLEEVCSEISRNGFKKIILLDAHGGNRDFLHYFIFSTLYGKRDYAVYSIRLLPTPEGLDELRQMMGVKDLGSHAGNDETSRIMAIRPDLVKMDRIEKEGLVTYGKLNHLKETYTAVNWYADHPTHFAGDPSHACVEAGKRSIELVVEKAAAAIKIIKEDTVVGELLDEFYSKCQY